MSDKMNYVDVIKYTLHGLTVMLSFMFFMLLSLFVYKNSLYFTMSLLIISISTLRLLSLNTYISSLTALIFIIVYVGAIIILIGYICAISPNMILEPDYSNIYLFLFLFIVFSSLDSLSFTRFSPTNLSMADFFYSSEGVFVFFTLAFMLFITLLIVTSQYTTPRGPFRAIKV